MVEVLPNQLPDLPFRQLPNPPPSQLPDPPLNKLPDPPFPQSPSRFPNRQPDRRPRLAILVLAAENHLHKVFQAFRQVVPQLASVAVPTMDSKDQRQIHSRANLRQQSLKHLLDLEEVGPRTLPQAQVLEMDSRQGSVARCLPIFDVVRRPM